MSKRANQGSEIRRVGGVRMESKNMTQEKDRYSLEKRGYIVGGLLGRGMQ